MTKDNKITFYGEEVVEDMWKECNLSKEEEREEIIQLLREWVRQQDHFIKKEYTTAYFEKCLITCRGSVEKTKKQIDKMCTFRTLLPQYFQVINVKESRIMDMLKFGHVGILPRLTEDYCRVTMVRIFDNLDGLMPDYTSLFFQLINIAAEYVKHADVHRGVMLVIDCYDNGLFDVMLKMDLILLREFLPILTEGYGAKIKGIIFVTSSKVIETFIKMIKPLFSAKIGSRLKVATSREHVKNFLRPVEMLPVEYGGKEPSLGEISDNLVEYLSSEAHQKLQIEMNAAKTDESKRRKDIFNDQYMGLAGTFRTLSVD